MLTDPEARRAVIIELAVRLSDRLGRTGVMKCMYLLQTLAGLKLGYQFRLYTYGPYDGQVLDDLSVAEALGAVRSKAFDWQGGTGYVITAGPSSEAALTRARRYLDSASKAIDWVVNKFGSQHRLFARCKKEPAWFGHLVFTPVVILVGLLLLFSTSAGFFLVQT